MSTLAASGSESPRKAFPRTLVHPLTDLAEAGDPYSEFLPPPMEVNADGDSEFMRAVVIVSEETQKGTARSPQEYVNPLLVLSGRHYASITFRELHVRICDALRGKGLQVVAQSFTTGGDIQLILSDGRIIDTRK